MSNKETQMLQGGLGENLSDKITIVEEGG